MNRIYRLVFNKNLNALVVASEFAKAGTGTRARRKHTFGSKAKALASLSLLGVALVLTSPSARSTSLPGGALLDINNGTGGNSASYTTPDVFQTYSVTFTATTAGNNYLLFAFRQDPAYWTFGNVSLVAEGSSTNLLQDPTFMQGGTVSDQSGLQAPAEWGIVYQTGTTPRAAGHWVAPGDTSAASTTNVNEGTAGAWYDGAVGSFDGIYQGVDLALDTTYTINFTALSNDAASPSGGIEMGVFVGPCASLSGDAADCVPDNPDFTVLATPSQTQDAGGPTSTPIDGPVTTTDLGTTDGAFDGGTLAVDGDTTLDQNFTINGNGGTIDQAGHEVTVNGTIADQTTGDGGTLAIINSGSGGDVVLTGTNTYTGTTTIDNGATLSLAGDGSIADSAGVSDNGTFDISGASGNADITTLDGAGAVDLGGNDLNLTDASGTFAGTIGGTGGVNINGGSESLSGANTYTGITVIDNGATLSLTGDGAIADSAGVTDSGTFDIAGANGGVGISTLDGTGTVDLGGNDLTLTDASGTFGGVIGGTGGLNVTAGSETLTQRSTYTGQTDIGARAILALDGSGGIDASSNVDVDGMLDISGHAGDVGISTLSGDGDVALGNNRLNLNEAAGTFAGSLEGSGGLTLFDGSETLTGDNTYTGGTDILGTSTLVLSGDGSIADSAWVNVQGTLDISGHNGDADITTLRGDGTVDLGANDLNLADASDAFNGTLGGIGGVKINGGSESLSAVNTYTGRTTIDNGATLAVVADGSIAASAGVNANGTFDISGANGDVDVTTLDGTGTVALGGNDLNLTDASGSFGGVIGGAGGLTLAAGTQVLGGTNTYTGDTTITGGTLKVGRDANLGGASSDVDLEGGTLQTTGSFESGRDITLGGGSFSTEASTTFTSDGAIDGVGGLVKNGQGTMVVNGVASHRGGTTVNAGVLILNGTNTYTGGITLSGGSLQVGSDANLGDASNRIAFDGGDLTVTRTMASDRDMLLGTGNASITTRGGVTFTANGDMSGTGGLIKRGDGTLVVSGNNTFTGGTLIDGGVIKIDSGSSLGTGVILLHGGMLQTVQSLGTGQTVLVSGDSGVNVDAGKTAELSGELLTDGSAGCFVKSGKGTLNMTGSATLSNGTCVQEGMLRANGMLASNVQVDGIGTLRGIGLVDGNLNVDGTLAPGNSPGTLTLTGTVTMNAGSSLQVDVDGHGTGTGKGNYSRLLVGGVFKAAGTLAPTLRGITGSASNAFIPALGDIYNVVEAAGGVQGTFDALQQPTAGLAANTRFQVFYVGGHAIDLYVIPASYAELLEGQSNGNTVRLGEAVDRMVVAQDAGTDSTDQHGLLFALAGLRASALPAVLQDLSGEVHAQEAAMAREASLGLANDMADHLAEAAVNGEHGTRAWATLSQGGYRASTDADATGFHTQQSRASVGLDTYRGDAALWGVGLAHTESRLEDTPASGSVRGNGVLLYGEATAGKVLFDGTASWSKDDWRTRRADPLAPASGLTAQADGHSTAASVTARLPIQHEGMRIEPYAQAVWQRVSREGFAESGDALTGLAVATYGATGTRVLAGVNLGSAVQDPLATSVTFRVGAAVGHDFGDTLNPVVDASLDGEAFALHAPSMGRNLLKLDASGTLRLGKQAYLYGGLNSATGRDRASYGVNAGVRVQF